MSSKVDNSFEYLNPTALNLSSEAMQPSSDPRRRKSPNTPRMLGLCSAAGQEEDEAEILPAYRAEDQLGKIGSIYFKKWSPSVYEWVTYAVCLLFKKLKGWRQLLHFTDVSLPFFCFNRRVR